MAAHDRRHIVAAGEQTGDRRARCRQHAPIGVGAQTDTAAERARVHRHRIERRRCDETEARVRLTPRIAVVAVEDGLAFSERFIVAGFGIAVALRDRLPQADSIDADFARQCLN